MVDYISTHLFDFVEFTNLFLSVAIFLVENYQQKFQEFYTKKNPYLVNTFLKFYVTQKLLYWEDITILQWEDNSERNKNNLHRFQSLLFTISWHVSVHVQCFIDPQ